MSVDISSWVWKHSPTKGSERILLLSLADNSNDQGFCWPSLNTIAKRCKMSRRYAQRIVHNLESEGHIIIHYRRDDERDLNKSNMYQVVVNRSSSGSELLTTTPSEQETTRVVNRSSPKSSLNRNKEPKEKESTPDGVRPSTPYVLNSEKMERCFSEARGCPLPDWEHDPKGSNKRWRMPLNKILKACDGNVDAACYFIAEITREFRKDNLTFTAPDQILESVTSRIIDRKARQVIYAEEH